MVDILGWRDSESLVDVWSLLTWMEDPNVVLNLFCAFHVSGILHKLVMMI